VKIVAGKPPAQTFGPNPPGGTAEGKETDQLTWVSVQTNTIAYHVHPRGADYPFEVDAGEILGGEHQGVGEQVVQSAALASYDDDSLRF
jgi:hypothetical protein